MRATVLLIFVAGVLGHAGSAQTGPSWQSLHSPEARVFAANLRAAGFPAEVVGLLVSHEINQRFREREARLQPSLKSLDTLREGWSAERREALLALKHERNALLREILGSVPDETARVEYWPETLAHLTPATREKVRLISEDYNAMITRIYAESRGALLEEDRAKLKFLEGERSADLVKTLGPEDAVDYQIYDSGYLKRIQARLELAKPTAKEIREMFLIRRRLNLDVESIGLLPPPKMEELNKQAMAELAKVLTPERFAEISRAGSRRYQQIYHLVRRLGKAPAIAGEIYAAQTKMCEAAFGDATKAAARTAATFEADRQRRRQLVDEHCAYVQRQLGEAGFLDYYAANQRMIDLMRKGGATAPDTGYIVF